ncbi:hypothetical protein GCM10010129_06720 [Streptomyces fumigatiscleroticus]|nr:hypothetical protein GCM10010129_06720 [Streptomyces fumigatiscleroticus]
MAREWPSVSSTNPAAGPDTHGCGLDLPVRLLRPGRQEAAVARARDRTRQTDEPLRRPGRTFRAKTVAGGTAMSSWARGVRLLDHLNGTR